MEINYIKEYLTLYSVKNYLEASEQLYISSSTLVRHIQKLEEELGFKLFDISGRSIIPSDMSKIFYPMAEEFVRLQEQCFSVLDSCQNQKEHFLRIGFLALEAPAYQFFGWINRFCEQNPNIKVELYEGESLELCRMLVECKLDLLFCYLPDSFTDITSHFPVVLDHMAVFMSRKDPLAKCDSIELCALSGKTMVPRPPQTFLNEFIKQVTDSNDIVLNTTFSPSGTANLLTMVSREIGISFMPRTAADYLVNSLESHGQNQIDVQVVDITPQIDIPLQLIWMDKGQLSPAGHTFLRYMQQFRISN